MLVLVDATIPKIVLQAWYVVVQIVCSRVRMEHVLHVLSHQIARRAHTNVLQILVVAVQTADRAARTIQQIHAVLLDRVAAKVYVAHPQNAVMVYVVQMKTTHVAQTKKAIRYVAQKEPFAVELVAVQ